MRRNAGMTIRLWFLCVVLGATGCANQQSIFESFDLSQGKSISIDAKQRVVLTTTRLVPDKSAQGNGKEVPVGYRLEQITCAEPSPDALAVLGASGGLSADVKSQIALTLSGGVSETATNIGLRTQTIQLLRDAMYRNCELYMNGAIDKVQVFDAHRRYQDLTAALLAIEQITGAVKAQSGAITAIAPAINLGDSTVNEKQAAAKDAAAAKKGADQTAKAAGSDAKKMTKVAATAKSEAAKAAKKKDDADKAAASDPSLKATAEKAAKEKEAAEGKANDTAKSAKAASDKATAAKENADEAAKTKEQADKDANDALGAANSKPIDSTSTAAVAKTVYDIISLVVGADYSAEACLSYYVNGYFKIALDANTSDPFSQYCSALINLRLKAVLGAKANQLKVNLSEESIKTFAYRFDDKPSEIPFLFPSRVGRNPSAVADLYLPPNLRGEALRTQ